MAGYFDATTENELVAEHHEEDATKQALEGLPRIAENFDASIARMRAARKTLQDANPALVWANPDLCRFMSPRERRRERRNTYQRGYCSPDAHRGLTPNG